MDTLDVVILVVAVLVIVASVATLPSRRRSVAEGRGRGPLSPEAAAGLNIVAMVLIIVSVLLR